MAVYTSIGSESDTGTATPTSCSSPPPAPDPDGYSVSFDSGALAGVSRGDMVTMVDDWNFYTTFIFRVVSLEQAPARATLVYISDEMDEGDTSPCDLLDMSGEQAECEFSRYYETIYDWEADLGNDEIYGVGSAAVGECHNDSVFDEQVAISNLGDLGSITLTVHPDDRHNGLAGSGARIKYTNTSPDAIIVLSCDKTTVEWLEIDNTDADYSEAAMSIDQYALEGITVRNMILHDVDPDDDVDERYGIVITNSEEDNVGRVILNNFIYNIRRTASSPLQQRDCFGIGEITTTADDDYGASYYNNTIRKVSTTNGVAYGYYVSPEAVVINNIALNCGTACFKTFDDSSGSDFSRNNLSDDNTAADIGQQPPLVNYAQTYDTGVRANLTVISTTNLHLRWVLNDPISLAVDRGTPLSSPDGILTDIDGDDRVYLIPQSVARGYWDIGADESVYSHPYPATAIADAAYYPTIPAAFVLDVPDPTVVVARPSISITPVVAALLLAAVSPIVTITNPSVSITPSSAAFELAAVSPTVATTVSVTPAAASFELAGVSPTAVAGSLSLTPSVAAVEFAGVSPSVQLSSLSVTPSASAFELVTVSPTVLISSASITPAVAAVEFAGISPSVVLSSLTVTPSASAFEFVAVDPSVGLSSLTVAPAASAVEFVGVSPSTILGSLSITPTVAALEFAAISPSVTRGSVSITPAAAITNYRARYGSIIFGGIVVIPVAEAEFAYTAVDPAVGLSSQTIAVSASAFELAGVSPSVIFGSITVSPAVSVVEFAASVATIHAGIEVTPAVAAFEYIVGSFTLHVDIASASLGYACDGLVDYRGSIPCDYEINGVLDYIGGVLPTDYQLEKNLDYRYDHQS